MVAVLGLTGLVSGWSLAYVYQVTKPLIEANDAARLEKALQDVLPQAQTFETVDIPEGVYFVGKDGSGAIVGYAALAQGNGYQGPIRMILGIDSRLEQMTGLAIFPNDETPGLGNGIIEKPWRDQFVGLAPYPRVEYFKSRSKEKPNEIEAVTGATISSRSVVNTVNQGLKVLLREVGGVSPGQASQFEAFRGDDCPQWVHQGAASSETNQLEEPQAVEEQTDVDSESGGGQ